MRFVTMRTADGTRAGRLDGDEVVDLDYADVGALLAAPGGLEEAGRADGHRHSAAELDLAPLVPDPPKIVCVGLNYATHIKEMGRELPDYPTYFAKYTRALIGPHDPIILPAEEVSEKVDWEAELAVVIGKRVRHATPEEALDAIAGYTVLNDISVRDWQQRTMQFLAGKTFESTTPVGPALVTRDELAAGDGRGLDIRCEVDGQVMQSSNTDDLLFGPIELVVDLSKILTLDPGDLIATGTTGGVGVARKPPIFLKPGQEVRTVIEGVGELLNVCEREKR